MEAKEAINKIKSLLGIQLAAEDEKKKVAYEDVVEDEVKKEVTEETTEKPVEETAAVEKSVEDRVAEIESRIEEMVGKVEEMYGIVTEIIDRQRKSDSEVKDEVKEEIREEVVEELSKTVPSAEPVHVQQPTGANKPAKTTRAERLAILMNMKNK